ncbi:hypothetical protein BH20VER1_BH20VER1_08390 [soil metagenome]
MRLAYLYSRYPVLSQTFCDTEMLEMERRGDRLLVGSVHPPLTTLRHAHAARLHALVHYAPPDPILQLWEEKTRKNGRWPEKLIERHERDYGSDFKAALRARNASYFAELFTQAGVQHFHVHFANRAAHTALFLKEMSGIPFSVTAHGQDFMSDLGSDALLREICTAAEFVAVETDFSRRLLATRCPDVSERIHRVYNGMDFTNFPPNVSPGYSSGPVKLLSTGRLVEFKGFANLIAACAELRNRGLEFTCEIVGDGPLRDQLQAQITQEELTAHVFLRGALPQQAVFEKLRSCDLFVLASVVDRGGASDVFPTVILEAMASSRPVVSTELAGIPEAVLHERTGLLVPPGDVPELALALDRMIRDQWMRLEFGNAGRTRVEQHFQVATTVEPLVELFEGIAARLPAPPAEPAKFSRLKRVGYLLDRWPDPELPLLETELLEMEKRNVAVTGFVGRLNAGVKLDAQMEQLATQLVFLPDPMVLEAQWQANLPLVHKLEDDRANQKNRAPGGLFLEQARYAIALRPLLQEHGIAHLHATSSRALVCAIMLKKLAGVTISATIENEPHLSVRALRVALSECEGGRVSEPKLASHLSSAFLLESGAASKLLSKVGGRSSTWQRWSELLVRWS